MREQPRIWEAATASRLQKETGGQCLPQWLLEHPQKLLDCQGEYLAAGAHLLCAPTGGVNALGLSALELPAEEAGPMNAGLVELTRKSAADKVPVAGIISPAGHRAEPFGPLPYTDLIDTYAEQALALARAGAQSLLLPGFTELVDIRAAVLGARQAALPVMPVLLADNGEQANLVDPLAVLLCLQELGICGFGVMAPDLDTLPPLLKRLAPYAKVPLAAGLRVALELWEETAEISFECLAAGARDIVLLDGASPRHLAAVAEVVTDFDVEAFPLPERKALAPIQLADSTQAYFLETDFSCSAPVTCWPDMSEPILEAEAEGADALLYHLRDVEDAYNLGQNAHKAHSPAVLLADSAEGLEMALLYYPGRALIHPDCVVEPPVLPVLRALAEGYGAVFPESQTSSEKEF